jgi:hypothetical protein
LAMISQAPDYHIPKLSYEGSVRFVMLLANLQVRRQADRIA